MSREEQQSADAPSVGGDLGCPSAASEAASDDPVFAAEQAHLSETYGKLEKIGRDALAAMEAVAAQAAEEQALSALKALEGRVRTLAGAPANRDYAAPLERLAEAIRFADGACASALDSELADKLTALETCLSGETAAGEVERRVEELLWTVERRGREVKERKAGKT